MAQKRIEEEDILTISLNNSVLHRPNLPNDTCMLFLNFYIVHFSLLSRSCSFTFCIQIFGFPLFFTSRITIHLPACGCFIFVPLCRVCVSFC